MSKRKSTYLAWGLCAITILGILAGILVDFRLQSRTVLSLSYLNQLSISLFLVISAVVASLIISRHPRNIIGWLLMFYPLLTGLLSLLNSQPPVITSINQLTLPIYLYLWVNSWSWWLFIGPILLIPLLFPTGKLLSRHWRWVIYALSTAFGSFLLIATFSPMKQAGNVEIPNPLGIIPAAALSTILVVFQILLAVSTIGSVAALFVRYRRAQVDEREQIKWLLYACGIFLIVYLIGFLQSDNEWWGIVFNIIVIGIPISIGAAILRYHLWDIDLIINRTLVYVPLTAILAGLYSASISLTQKFLVATTGQKSDTALVMTTFILVAAFTPIKNVLQQFVDKHFKDSTNPLKQIRALDTQVRSVMEVLDGNQLTHRLLQTSLSAFNASSGAVYLINGEQMRLIHASPGWRDEDGKLSLPLQWAGRHLGLLCLGTRKSGLEYSKEEQHTLQQAVDQVAWAITGSVVAVDE